MGKFLKAMKRFIHKIAPFFIFGIMIFIFVAGLIILSYILIFGALIGLILFAIQKLREKFFSQHSNPSHKLKKVERKGRIIDHDDF